MAKVKTTGDCAICSYWRRKASPVKGKLVPGGTGKCTREEGLCENPKPKDPIPERKGKSKKEGGLRQQAPETIPQSPQGSNEVPLNLIYPNPAQPRKVFPREALEELALSIKEQGLIEPLVVVPKGEKFMLIAGERRWRACQMAGIVTAPVRILEADDRQIAEMALVENIQRQDLTPLEEARAFKEMLDKNGYTKEELAQKLGFKQVWRVDERLSLLNLAPKFQDALTFGIITPSQGFEISRLSDAEDQEVVFRKIKAGELPTYNHLRRFVTAMVDSKKDKVLFAMPKKQDLEIVSRWEKTLDAVTGLIVKSFSPEDCKVLARVCQGNAQVNLIKIDMIIKHLNLVKKAMLENASRQEVYGIINGGANLVPVDNLNPA
jgi:ParB family chromosome partitioning protein